MEKLTDTTGPLEFHRAGLRLVPLDGKRAIVKNWPELHLSADAIRVWMRRPVNWGAITGDPLIALDTDTDRADDWVRALGIDFPVQVRSGGGGTHYWCRLSENVTIVRCKNGVHGIPGLDVKGYHGLIVLPGSIHPETGQRYKFVPGREFTGLADLPPFDPKWVQEIRKEPYPEPESRRPRIATGAIKDIRCYIRGIASIENQAGSNACYRVAALLFDAGYSQAEALEEMLDWEQTNAFPLWGREALLKKITDVWKRKLAQSLK